MPTPAQAGGAAVPGRTPTLTPRPFFPPNEAGPHLDGAPRPLQRLDPRVVLAADLRAQAYQAHALRRGGATRPGGPKSAPWRRSGGNAEQIGSSACATACHSRRPTASLQWPRGAPIDFLAIRRRRPPPHPTPPPPHLLVHNVPGPVAPPLEPLQLHAGAGTQLDAAARRELHVALAAEVRQAGALEDDVAAAGRAVQAERRVGCARAQLCMSRRPTDDAMGGAGRCQAHPPGRSSNQGSRQGRRRCRRPRRGDAGPQACWAGGTLTAAPRWAPTASLWRAHDTCTGSWTW